MPSATKQQPLQVELPTCPYEGCNRVGKIPGSFASGRFYCTGSVDAPHRRTKMEMRRFQEVAA